MTQHLGFRNYGDEYKVMGLSAYGKPKYFEKLKNIINIKKNTFELNLNYFSHHYNFSNYVSTDGNIMFPKIFNQKIHEIIGPERLKDQKLNEQHADLAASVQKIYEYILFNNT